MEFNGLPHQLPRYEPYSSSATEPSQPTHLHGGETPLTYSNTATIDSLYPSSTAQVPAKELSSPGKVGATKGRSPKGKKHVSKEERLRTPDPKFGGLTEEDVKKLLLPDHLAPDLDIIFVGINPGLVSAYKGHHYCNPTNHFWPLLFESGLISERLTYESDFRSLEFGIGMTNIVPRTTRSAAELSKKEIEEGKDTTIQMIARLKPHVVCFNGKGIYEIFSGGKCVYGRQPDICDTAVYVMPSTSGLVAQYPSRKDKLVFFNELKQIRDIKKNGTI